MKRLALALALIVLVGLSGFGPVPASRTVLCRNCTCVPPYSGGATSLRMVFDIPETVGTAEQRSAFQNNMQIAANRWNSQFAERNVDVTISCNSNNSNLTVIIDPNRSGDNPEYDGAGHIIASPDYVTQNGLSAARIVADMQHELGHAEGFGQALNCAGGSLMADWDPNNPVYDFTDCDYETMFDANFGTPGGGCGDCDCWPDPETVFQCEHQSDFWYWDYNSCQCVLGASPILIDLDGHGFQLTSAQDGVRFDLMNNGHPMQVAWTAAESRDAFLVLDRNNNGLIDNASELFGNFSPQPETKGRQQKNGFLALAVYDRPDKGGNGDGKISSADSVFGYLRLWVDSTHDGFSQPSELFTLQQLGVTEISLQYTRSRRTDEFGNRFRYRSHVEVNLDPNDRVPRERSAVDVFFVYIKE